MKKLLLLMMLVTTLVKAAALPPTISTPLNMYGCDNDNFDNQAVFDLTSQNAQIMGSLSTSSYSIAYYETQTDANSGSNPISNSTNYTNTINPQTIYVRVWENANPTNFATTQFQLIIEHPFAFFTVGNVTVCQGENVNIPIEAGPFETIFYTIDGIPAPPISNTTGSTITLPFLNVQSTFVIEIHDVFSANNFSCAYAMNSQLVVTVNPTPVITSPIPDLTVYENPYDGSALFDLTSQDAIISNGAPGNIVSYYTSLADAQNQTGPITAPAAFIGTHLQTIWAKVQDPATGCNAIGSFQLKVFDSNLVVYIPDANFKAKLLSGTATTDMNGYTVIVDANNDGEIQYSEALLPAVINVPSSNISDLTGISAFTNLRYLSCDHNSITSLDASALTLIEGLYCYNNQLTNLNVSGLTHLYNLYCAYNNLTSLDVSGLTGLFYLYCFHNNITSLNVSGLPILNTLYCYSNQLTSLTLSGIPNLAQFDCSYNQLTSLNVTGFVNLQNIACNYNQISSLDISSIHNLYGLGFSNNLFTSIDVSGQPHLRSLACANNQLTTLNLSGLNEFLILDCSHNQITNLQLDGTVLQEINCSNNQLTSLDLSPFPTLIHTVDCSYNLLTNLNVTGLSTVTNLFCNNNQLGELDLHTMSSLTGLMAYSNDPLVYINIKNGQYYSPFSYIIFDPNPNLMYMCVDEDNIGTFNYMINFNMMPNPVQVTSYCTFEPYTDHNTITGTVLFDANNNGCDSGDIPQPYIKATIDDTYNQGATFTNATGNYTFYSQGGTFTIAPEIENPSFFTISPASATIPFTDLNNTVTQDFCIAPNGVHTDLEVVIAPVTPARPGFDAVYKITYKNKGNVNPGFNSGVRFDYNPNQMSFVSASQTVGTQGVNYINFDYSNLMPFESRTITVTFHINSPTDSNPVAIGDVLHLHSNVGLNIGDENPDDNEFYYDQTVVGAFDPNMITCIEGPSLQPSEIGKYLHYMVNFENTGNYEAQNIVVKDIIDPTKYDISSLQLLNTSDPAYVRINGNIVEFIFQNINLAAAAGNPPVGGHGNVLFKIKSKGTLEAGDFVSKSAKIYFDYNAPIDTNIAQTIYASLKNAVVTVDDSVTVYPNPTSSIIKINCKNTITSIELFDVQGRIIETSLYNETSTKIDLTNKQSGIYFVKVNTEYGSKVEKVVKE